MEGNLGYGSSRLEDHEATSVFLLGFIVGERSQEVKNHITRVLNEIEGTFGDFFAKISVRNKGYLPRNTDLLNRDSAYFSEDFQREGYKIGSFELTDPINYGGIYKCFTSGEIGLELGQIENESSINRKVGLRMEIKECSEITLSKLGEIITDFIANFIKKYNLEYSELETFEKNAEDSEYKWINAVLPNEFDAEEKQKLLFSISQSIKRNTIYFTDLTPIHPNFLHDLLLHLDNVFGKNE